MNNISNGIETETINRIAIANHRHHHEEQKQEQETQGLTALLVMIAVLCILLAYCFWGAPWCRSFCRRRICCSCPMDEPEEYDINNTNVVQEQQSINSPTIILLPFGRMLLVDSSVFTQFNSDANGMDLMELGQDLIRMQRYQTASISTIDSETTSKSPTLLNGFPPPTYESIFGSKLHVNDLPPSYSEVNLQIRMNQMEHICPIAEEECDRIANSDEDVTI